MKPKIHFFFSILTFISFGFQLESKTDSVSIYTNNQQPEKALNFLIKKENFFKKNKDFRNYCEILIKKAEQLKKFDDSQGALETLYEARNIAEINHYQFLLAKSFLHIAKIYATTLNYSDAKLNVNKALFISKKNNYIELELNCYQTYYKISSETNTNNSLTYLNKINNLTKKIKITDRYCTNYTNYAAYYLNNENFKAAKIYLDSAFLYYNKTKNIDSKCNLLNLFSSYYLFQNDYKKAIPYLDNVLKLYPNSENKNIIGGAYLNYSYAYEQLGDFKKANEYLNKYLNINEEINKGRIEQKTKELEIKYAINKIENQYKTKEIKLEESKRRNIIILLLSSFFVLSGILILYFYYQNLLLKQKNKIKDLDKELQYKVISATLDGQEQERNNISAVLHDSVSATLSSVGLHLSAFEGVLTNEQKNDLKKTRSLLKQAHDKVRDLSHELVPPILVKFGLQYALNDLCEKNSNSIIDFEFDSELAISKRFDPDFETKMYYIISELINNTIKHSKASKASLELKQTNEKELLFVLTDNGIGFNLENINNSNGFGLTQIKARIINMGGKFEIISNPGKTIIKIETLV